MLGAYSNRVYILIVAFKDVVFITWKQTLSFKSLFISTGTCILKMCPFNIYIGT